MAEPVLDWSMPCDAHRLAPPLAALHARLMHAKGREAALLLGEAARLARTGASAHVRLLAAGLAFAGRPQQAVRVLYDLVSARPAEALPRIDLACAYFETRRPDEALRELLAAGERCGDDTDLASMVVRRTEQLRGWLRWSEEYFTHQSVRAAAMRERIAAGLATIDDRVALTRSLLALTLRPGGGEAELAEAIEVLEEARRVAPRNVPVLELLYTAYLSSDHDEARHVVERDLERFAPHSRFLDDDRTDDMADVTLSEHLERLDGLAARAFQRDPGALEELRSLYPRYRADLNLLSHLMISEMVFGNRNEVRRLAEELAALPGLPHAAHFNLAQAYYYLGRQDLGRRHFDRADALAATDADRRDVAAMRAALEAPGKA